MPPRKRCLECGVDDTEFELFRCTKCKQALYCSRECQKKNWAPFHKVWCGTGIGDNIDPSVFFPDPDKDEEVDDWLHELPPTEVYARLIDCYRMRVADVKKFSKKDVGIYAAANPIEAFEEFLIIAENRDVLPPWWNKRKRLECLSIASKVHVDKSVWLNLGRPITTEQMKAHYNDNMMPEKLRVLAERVYLTSVEIKGANLPFRPS
ncbi:hypothetical protein EDC01DRAFT_732015 [Geopyxis carbonaria]|nr:hypothetical protein EDC01DRAFT_732015 [Geopyxis carbonaria]